MVDFTASAPDPTPGATSQTGSAVQKEMQENAISTIDDLIRHRARTGPRQPLLAYPDAHTGEFVLYTAQQLDTLADAAATHYQEVGLVPFAHVVSPTASDDVVALLGPSNLDYIVATLALTRLGFAVLFLSPRLPTEAYVSLLAQTGCRKVVHTAGFERTVGQIARHHEEQALHEQTVTPWPLVDVLALPPSHPPPRPSGARASRTAFIVHSSGSTGLPKPIAQSHAACLANYAVGGGSRALVTLPLYHNHGLCTLFRGIAAGRAPTAFLDAGRPLTGAGLVKAMAAFRPESFHGVPYALKLLAEAGREGEGVKALRRCQLVLFGGSGCPEELGDMLVKEGVYLVGHYGATEMGQLMTSSRPAHDKGWNYMRPLPHVAPYLRFEPVSEDKSTPPSYECIVLDGLPTKLLSNSSDPYPSSYRTRDTFAPHPTLPSAWRFLGRLDDRVNLVNGEKVLPVPFEHRVRQSALVAEALVFGVGRAFPGLLVWPSEQGGRLGKKGLLEELWPVIEEANSKTERFGRVPGPGMVEVMDVGTEWPRTDKGTVMRAAAYREYAGVIDAVYARYETHDEARDGALRVLDVAGLEAYLCDVFADVLFQGDDEGNQLQPETDFFDAGADSLQAAKARARIVREVDVGGRTIGRNVVFEFPSVAKLAAHLYALRVGDEVMRTDEVALMASLIEKYSDFPEFVPGDKKPEGEVVLLTGATGSLGAHILVQLLALPGITKIYCLVRASSRAEAQSRIVSSLAARRLPTDIPLHQIKSDTAELVALPSDLSQPTLGLDPPTLAALQASVTTVLHSAWLVNFNVGLAGFARAHVAGVHHLLRLCLGVPFAVPARFFFVSSIAAAAGTPGPATVEEEHVEDSRHAQGMGYARSKLVAEHIVRAAGRGRNRGEKAGQERRMVARVLRTGQLMGDTKHGVWNPTEAIPLMIRSVMTLGALPALDENPSWLPVDKCATAILELAGLAPSPTTSQDLGTSTHNAETVYHVLNPTRFAWTADLLPALRATGRLPAFDVVAPAEWLRRLRASDPDPAANPAVKLLDFWTAKYGDSGVAASESTTGTSQSRGKGSGLVFATTRTAEASATIREGVDVLGSGILARCIDFWSGEWEGGGGERGENHDTNGRQ